MFYKILEKYTNLKAEHNQKQNDELKSILSIDEEVMNNFMKLFDKDVKAIHNNQELIEKDLQLLYKETDKMSNNTKIAIDHYNNFVEYLKVNFI
jgi:hypothetical protein